jgi:hypothetical protein
MSSTKITHENRRLWLEQLVKFRNGLPMESTLFLPEELLDAAFEQGFEHIKGALLYANLLDELEGDPDQAWTDLVLRLDDASYYAIMAMPLVRQYLMSNPQETVALTNNQVTSFRCRELPSCFAALNGQRSLYAKTAWELAEKFSILRKDFFSAESLDDFLRWCVCFIELSGMLVSLAAHLCRKRWSQLPHEHGRAVG